MSPEEYIPCLFSREGWEMNIFPKLAPAVGQRLLLEVYDVNANGAVKCRWVIDVKETP